MRALNQRVNSSLLPPSTVKAFFGRPCAVVPPESRNAPFRERMSYRSSHLADSRSDSQEGFCKILSERLFALGPILSAPGA